MTSFASPASFIGFDNSWVGSILANRGAPAAHGETRRGIPASPITVAPVTAPQDDAELLERVAGGDPRAYRDIVERHMRGVHAFVYRMLGSRAEAEEVCQESFLRLWQQADTFVARAKPSTWLYRVAHNLAIDRLRRRRETSHSAGIEEVPNSERPSLHVYDKQVAEAVERALSELPERQRAAISLVFYQGLSNAEAADVIGVKVRALESLLARGRQQLRERLQDYRTREGNDV
jgi:RNA polymerase sigma-70 factor (ECF subfamily)